MPYPVIQRCQPHFLTAIACGNLLFLNLALAPSVFASRAEVGEPSLDRSLREAPRAEGHAQRQKSGVDEVKRNTTPMATGNATAATTVSPARVKDPAGRCEESDFHTDVAHLGFASDSDVLLESSTEALAALIARLPQDASSIWVDGHADPRGSADHNNVLSLRRAQRVGDTMAQMGVPRTRIVLRSFGESNPGGRQRTPPFSKHREAVLCIGKTSL